MRLFLEPMDVWLFRDGKPFDAFSDHRARSLFPPYPSVTQGAFRSHHLVVKGVDLHDQKAIEATVGTAQQFGDLKMRGPFIARREGERITRYFPVPADVMPDKEAGYRLLRPKARRSIPHVITNTPDELPMLFWPPEGSGATKEDLGQWMSEEELLRCLRGEMASAIRSDKLFEREDRFSIERRNDTRTTEEGALYEVEFIRPHKDVGLWVQVEGYDGWPKSGILRIGGEGRGAHFTEVEHPLNGPSTPDPLPLRFKVYFATPTYFGDGWKPKGGWGQFFDGTVTLQGIALNRYESIGGFDWATNDQKPARRCVPAGSVYYFLHGGEARLKQEGISEHGSQIGFGQVVISEWKE